MTMTTTTTNSSAMSALKPGMLIDGRYRIESVLSRGAMGWVYDTTHIFIERRTAIKILDVDQPILDTPEYRRRFLYEAKVTASLNHPHVIRIHDFGTFGEREIPYIAMQFLEGHDVRDELERVGKLSPARALRILVTSLSALSVAHRDNIVHKDIKPANLFLLNPGTRDERVIVLDFGVARMNAHEPDGGSSMTRVGEISGTPEYLAPEYITHQIVTPALDVYSMGLLFVELLTGETLVQGDNHMMCLMAHLQGPLALPKAVEKCLLAPIIKRALSPDHTERFQNAGEFLAALDGIKHELRLALRNDTFWGIETDQLDRTHPSLPAVPQQSIKTPYQGVQRLNLEDTRQRTSPSASPRVVEAQDFDTLLKAALRKVAARDVPAAIDALEACRRVRPDHRLVNNYLRILKSWLDEHRTASS